MATRRPDLGERLTHQQPPASELQLLGGFHLRCRGRTAAPPNSAQRLLALLALHGTELSRGFVAGTLWLDSNERRAAGSLRSALWRLRQTDPELVETRSGSLRLGDRVSVDVNRLVAASRRVRAAGSVEELDDELFAQDLLPGWYEDWVLVERERLRQLRLDALETAADRLIDAGDFRAAVRAALAAVQCESLRESSHRVLVRAHVAGGNYAAALRQYRLYARLLRDELGLAPSHLMRELVAPLMQR